MMRMSRWIAVLVIAALGTGITVGPVPSGTAKKRKAPVPISAQLAKLVASDGAATDNFGYSVSVSGDVAVVGAYADDDGGATSGSAYVFTRSGTTWIQQDKLVAADAAAGDWFGYSVAISGGTAVVGAYADDHDGGINAGSAYVFTRSGTTWTQQQKLVGPDAAAGDVFGYSVAVSGDVAVVGAPFDTDGGAKSGSAHVFTRSGTTWSAHDQLIEPDDTASDNFGISVAVSGDVAVVGSPFGNNGGTNSGLAYVFTRTDSGWSEQDQLLASDPAGFDSFGYSVAVSGDVAVVGAYADDDGGDDSGSAYVFTRSGSTWSEQDKLVASDPAEGDWFGGSVAISGDTAVVGALADDDDGDDSGSAYVFTRTGSTWTEQDKLVASDPAAGDNFGWSVAVSGDTAVVGSPFDDDDGNDSGSAYMFGPRPLVWIDGASAPEGDTESTPLSFTLRLSGPVDHKVKVTATTKNGTAKEPSDYKATSKTITFLPGETEKTFIVKVKGDVAVEHDEIFSVRLSGPKKAVIGNKAATGLIINDD